MKKIIIFIDNETSVNVLLLSLQVYNCFLIKIHT